MQPRGMQNFPPLLFDSATLSKINRFIFDFRLEIHLTIRLLDFAEKNKLPLRKPCAGKETRSCRLAEGNSSVVAKTKWRKEKAVVRGATQPAAAARTEPPNAACNLRINLPHPCICCKQWGELSLGERRSDQCVCVWCGGRSQLSAMRACTRRAR